MKFYLHNIQNIQNTKERSSIQVEQPCTNQDSHHLFCVYLALNCVDVYLSEMKYDETNAVNFLVPQCVCVLLLRLSQCERPEEKERKGGDLDFRNIFNNVTTV